MAHQQTADRVSGDKGAATLAERLEELSARIPGVVGYRQREACRETDKAVRLRLAAGLEDLKRQIEQEQRRRTETHQFLHLASLGRLTSKLDKLANLVRFASRGYRGLFDAYKLSDEKLQRLYGFDVDLLDEVESLRGDVGLLCEQHDDDHLPQAIEQLDQRLDGFESAFAQRANVLSSE
jgi:hypothetical protein